MAKLRVGDFTEIESVVRFLKGGGRDQVLVRVAERG